MFYLNEFFLRFKYIYFSFILTFICFFHYKDSLVALVSFSLLNTSELFGNFIFTHPTELLKVQFYIITFFSSTFCIPYVLWNILEFVKSSLFYYEYKVFRKTVVNFFLFLYFSNFLINFILFPKIWCFFENFNLSGNSTELLYFSFELRIEEYLKFLIDFTFVVNAFFLIFFFLLFLILKFGVANLLKWKKLFILLNIVFATLLSPPDVYSQLIILTFLSFILEVSILFFLYLTKISKHYLELKLVR